MKRYLLILAVAFLFTSAKAKTFYFSSFGNDSYTITQAQKSATPWKTINKLNSIFSTLLPGDSVLFNRGNTFYGSIISNASGSSVKYITIAAYGSGVDPVISGLTTISSWTSLGGGIYESSAISPESAPNVVIIKNVQYAMGRTPNSTYLTFESHTNNSITDNTNPFTSAYNGSQLVARTSQYTLDRNPVTTISGNTINFSGGFDNLINNFGYFLQNSIKTLDKYGEWYYNPTTHKLAVYFGTQPTSNVLVSTNNILLSLSNNYIIVRGLSIKGANNYGIHSDNAGSYGMNIKNCTFSYCGINGISIYGRNSINIDSCTFRWCNSSGINTGYRDTLTVVTNSIFSNIATFQGMLTPDVTDLRYGFGVFSENGLTATNNRFNNIGYIPIYFTMNNNLIQNNYIDTFCTILSDGGGIYTYNYTPTQPPKVWTNRIISNNTVLHGIGAKDGTWDSDPNYNPVEGIYLDDNSMNVNVFNNTVSYCADAGLYIHNSQNCNITGNTFSDNQHTQLLTQHGNPELNITGITFKHNTLSTSIDGFLMKLNSDNNDFKNIGTFDSNYYCNQFSDIIIQINWFGHSTTNYTLSTWQQTFNKDIHTQQCAGVSISSLRSYYSFKIKRFNCLTQAGAEVLFPFLHSAHR